MPDLQIDWLKCFVATVDAGSLSAAAAEVHRSQSAVSMKIRKLESAVGHTLLLRGPRLLQLTPAGQTLLGHARRMLDVQAEALALQGRPYKVVYNSSNLAGQIAAVESGLAIAALTQCSAPAHLQVLGAAQGLGPLQPMEVAVYRSQASKGSKAVDSLQQMLVQTLRQAAG